MAADSLPKMKVPLTVRAIPSFAERAWFTPPPLPNRVRSRWEDTVREAEPIEIEWSGELHHGYSIGSGPLVVLVHGWGGRASQMGELANAIAGRGYRALAVDAPGHGQAKFDTTNIFEMSELLDAVVERFGRPESVVAHSLGAMATVNAMSESMPRRLVLLAPILDVEQVLEVFAARAALMPWTANGLRRRIRRFVGDDWDAFRAGPLVELGDAEVLVVHDPEDPDAPFATSATLAAVRDNTRVVVGESLGHTKLLTDSPTVELVAGFVAGSQMVDSQARSE